VKKGNRDKGCFFVQLINPDMKKVLFSCLLAIMISGFAAAQKRGLPVEPIRWNLEQYNVVWDSPGKDAFGSMPLGNGDIGANVWVEDSGDIVLLPGKTDAFDEFNRLLKLGRVRIKTQPSILENKSQFVQILHLANGLVEIKTTVATIRVWVDANHPVVQVDCKSAVPMKAQVLLETWRKQDRNLLDTLSIRETFSAWGNQADKKRVNADTVLPHRNNQLAWCHHNIESQWVRNLELTALSSEISKYKDPVLNKTFGALIRANQFTAVSDTVMHTSKAVHDFSVQVFPVSNFSATALKWLSAAELQAGKIIESTDKRLVKHESWWHQFWNRSYIELTSAQNKNDSLPYLISRAYNLQRFVNACAGRGVLPIKFNGSLFTVAGPDPDFRAWGGGYWWQNTRCAYWSMLYSGDYEMMLPLFKMYMDALPLRQAATQKYYGHEGAFYPETIYFWGNYMDTENYGNDRKNKPDGLADNTYIRYYWQSGIEMIVMMLDYYDATLDRSFLNHTLIPFAKNIALFYAQHWNKNAEGKIVFDPAQSLETWHSAINPTPEIAGLKYVLSRLLALQAKEPVTQQWKELLSALPEVPMKNDSTGKKYILPAAKFSNKSNIENPELYAVFPYRVFTDMSSPDSLKIAVNTWQKRQHPEDYGWQQNCIQAALLGLGEEAGKMMEQRALRTAKGYRFPGFFGPNYDWTPEQCHATNMMTALQRMLMQCEGNRIVLLPAFPKGWNAKFKLHAAQNTTVEGEVTNGQLKKYNITPLKRKADVDQRCVTSLTE